MLKSKLALVTAVALLFTAGTTSLAQAQSRTGDLKNQKHLFEVGLYLGAYISNDRHELYKGTEHQPFKTAAFDVGLRLSYLPVAFLGVELEAGLIPNKTESGDSALMWALRGHAIFQLPLFKRWAPFLVVGGGALGVKSEPAAVGTDNDAFFHWGVGLKVYATDWLALRLDLRHLVGEKSHDQDYTSHFEALIGASFVVGWKGAAPVKDKDGDGVPDAKDKCPTVASKTADGCPADKDGDGVPDAKDKCPDVAAKTADGCPADKDGDGVPDAKDKCPDVAAKTADGCPADADGDGVPDAKDKCPDVAAKTADGCPADKDGDGVPDAKDKCPDVAAKTADGCPPDADGDGIIDSQDKCPNKPETKNGYQDEDGCPDKLPKAIKRFTGAIRGITFASGKSIIRRASYRTLNRAVSVLKKFPKVRMKVRGHTDDRGKLDLNMKLSLARAEAVKAYFVKKGIAASRIQVEGVGPKEPETSNKTARGRARNRRIEFKLLTR